MMARCGYERALVLARAADGLARRVRREGTGAHRGRSCRCSIRRRRRRASSPIYAPEPEPIPLTPAVEPASPVRPPARPRAARAETGTGDDHARAGGIRRASRSGSVADADTDARIGIANRGRDSRSPRARRRAISLASIPPRSTTTAARNTTPRGVSFSRPRTRCARATSCLRASSPTRPRRWPPFSSAKRADPSASNKSGKGSDSWVCRYCTALHLRAWFTLPK